MYLKVKNKKIEIKELTTFWERFKGLKFIFEPIDYGIKFPHKRFSTTNFLCQKIDVILTDREDNILYIYENLGTEQYIFPMRKVYNTYFLPIGTAKNFKVGDKFLVIDSKNKSHDKKSVGKDKKSKKKKN